MATDIITAQRELAAFLEAPATPVIGRPAKPYRAAELAPVINKHPTCYAERVERIRVMKREGYVLPVDDYFESLEIGCTDNDGQDAFNAFQAINWS